MCLKNLLIKENLLQASQLRIQSAVLRTEMALLERFIREIMTGLKSAEKMFNKQLLA